jgi:hypothetical protein
VAESIQARTWRRDSDLEEGDGVAGPPEDASFTARAGRAAADARYQAFVSAGAESDPDTIACHNYAAPHHDYDHCVRDSVPDAVLFQKEDADADAVDSRDVQQGGLGDCHFLAPLAALASTARGRALIRSAIVENKNDQGDVASWTVTLHKPETHLFARTTFRAVQITVGEPYVIGHARVRAGGGHNEIWPLVIEKAYAQYAGGYNNIGRGGVPSVAMAVLTGREAMHVSFDWPNRWFQRYGAGELQTDLANGKMVILCTRAGIGRPLGPNATPAQRQANLAAHGLLQGHAYFAAGVEQHDGRLFLKLGNPWGVAEPGLVPCDELAQWFSGVAVGSVP